MCPFFRVNSFISQAGTNFKPMRSHTVVPQTELGATNKRKNWQLSKNILKQKSILFPDWDWIINEFPIHAIASKLSHPIETFQAPMQARGLLFLHLKIYENGTYLGLKSRKCTRKAHFTFG